MYLNITPSQNDGKTIYKLQVKDVPIDGFWSISIYNEKGYFVKNALDVYTHEERSPRKKMQMDLVAVHFGGCGEQTSSVCADYTRLEPLVRLYRPAPGDSGRQLKFPRRNPCQPPGRYRA